MSQKIFFTADLHLGHKNILTMTKRKFNSIEEHDNHVINCINSVVKPEDYLYILGDLGFHRNFIELLRCLSEINCKNIHVIKGNHDSLSDLVQLKRNNVIADVKEMKTVQKGSKSVFCCHYPMREWPGFYRGHYHAYGHVHATLPIFEKSIDVGVDSIGFTPIEFDELVDKIDSQYREIETKVTDEDVTINEFFPDLNTHYFVNLCVGSPEIRDKIFEVLRRK